MSDEKKVTNTDEEIVSTEETIASTREQKDNYEVGYGKPPKNTRFPKGASGNPSGRRKKGRDLDAELSKELNSTINIRENGKPKRISKVQGIIKRFANEALAGDIRAARFILTDYKELLEREAVSAVQEAKELQRLNNIDELTTEELLWIAAGNDPKELLRRRKMTHLERFWCGPCRCGGIKGRQFGRSGFASATAFGRAEGARWT